MKNLKSISYLSQIGASFNTILVAANVHSVADVQRACECDKAEVIKTLLLVGQNPVAALMTGDKKVDIEKLKQVTGDMTLRMARPVEVFQVTGQAIGAVSPFGLEQVSLIADEEVRSIRSLIMGSGRSDVLLKMTHHDFMKSYQGSFARIAIS